MKLATTTADFDLYNIDNFEIIERIANAGFKYVDFNFSYDAEKFAPFLKDD